MDVGMDNSVPAAATEVWNLGLEPSTARVASRDVYLSVVVPALNGGERLPATLRCISAFLRRQPYTSELIVVDDHSCQRTAELLSEFARTAADITVMRNDRNRGKGYSVARGILAAKGKYRVFIDADFAYPASEIAKVLHDLERGTDVAIACRVLPESRYIMSPGFFHYLYTRHLMSRLFNAMTRSALLPGIFDTQAGLKGFTAEAVDLVFLRLTIDRFGFDLECLFIARAHNLRITQTAVEFHYDDEPTTMNFIRDALCMMADITTVRWNGWRGIYG